MVFLVKGNEALDARLNVRLPSSELHKIKDDAFMASISVSEIVRSRYFGRKVVANTDLLMIKELRRIGGLLKLVHVESNGAYSNDTAASLIKINEYITLLANKK